MHAPFSPKYTFSTFSYSHTGISVLCDRGFDSSSMESPFRPGRSETYHAFGAIRVIVVDPELWSFSHLFGARHQVPGHIILDLTWMLSEDEKSRCLCGLLNGNIGK